MPQFLDLNYDGRLLSESKEAGSLWQHIGLGSCDQLQAFLGKASYLGIAAVVGLPQKLRGYLGPVAYLDLSGLCHVIEHNPSDQVISVEAGMSIASLNELLAQQNQWWPVGANDDKRLIVDLIGSGDPGCLEHGFGGPRDLVLGLSVCLANGKMIACGGKVVKNVTGYDLQKIFIGSQHCLGIVSSANLRLYSLPEASQSIVYRASNSMQAFRIAAGLNKSGLPVSCLEIVNRHLLEQLSASSQTLSELSGLLSGHDSSTFVCCQVHGPKRVVDALVRSIQDCLSGESSNALPISQSSSLALWSSLDDPQRFLVLDKVELVASMRQLNSILNSLDQTADQLLWQARPARGRLKLYMRNRDSIDPLIKSLRSTLSAMEPAVVAYYDRQGRYCLNRIPADDEVARKLKHSLKMRFDSGKILNPFICWQGDTHVNKK